MGFIHKIQRKQPFYIYLIFQIHKPSLGILQYILLEGMLNQKENYLNIEYQRGRGLRLNWNFRDILGREKYFRHLIIIADDQRGFINSFVKNFYKKMKYGDILSCAYLTADKQVKLCKWVEKTHINTFKVEAYLKYMSYSVLDDKQKKLLMDRAARQSSQNHDFMVVNILLPLNHSARFYKDFVEERRLDRNQFNYIVNIFTKNGQSRISVYKGINYFKISPENIKELAQFYHNFVNNAVMPYVSIKIECLNGQIGLITQQKWRNADFNSIQAKFYGPSSQFKCDQLMFYIQDLTRQMDIHLQITFNFKLFTLKKYETVKKMYLTYSYQKDGSLTMNQIPYPRYKIYKNIYLEEDPYESITIVKLFKNKLHQNSSSFQIL